METSALSWAVGEDDDVEDEEETCVSRGIPSFCVQGVGGVNLSHFSPPSCPLGPDTHCPGGSAVDHLPTGLMKASSLFPR